SPATHEIAQVQGAGAATPLSGQTVRVEGVVTADFQRTDQLSGFFVQDPAPDDDPDTSDGIFVYNRSADVNVGDRVLVTGRAIEYQGLTELSPVTAVDVCGTARPIRPANVELPLDRATESYEGMLVRYTQPLTATETYQLGRYGELTASADGRLFQPTEGRGSTQAENDARRILIDDGSNVQNPDTVPFTDPHAVRIGDKTWNLTGVLSYGFGLYRLQPTTETRFARTNPRAPRPAH
ncbi:endonuclease/exonuclease/phosphatase, partial [Actinomadura adrarensis]